jgi:flagellar biosynthesis/type III secretory pathway protein FliH
MTNREIPEITELIKCATSVERWLTAAEAVANLVAGMDSFREHPDVIAWRTLNRVTEEFNEGYDKGFTKGRREGRMLERNVGYSEGHDKGYAVGYREGQEDLDIIEKGTK